MAADVASLVERITAQAALMPGDVPAVDSAVFDALRAGRAAAATGPMERLCAMVPDQPRCHWLLAMLRWQGQRHETALAAIEAAARIAPGDVDIAMLRAQIHYETGRPAAALFQAARGARPGDPQAARNHAGALAAEGRGAEAEALMLAMLAARPAWVEGQTYLATLRRLAGDAARDDRGFSEAVAAEPGNPALRLGWFHWLAKCRDWPAAAEVLAQARQALGDLPALAAAALYLASESGGPYDPALFDGVEDKGDPGLDLARVRHALRGGAADRAAGIAQRHLSGPAARLFWPYMAIAWRLTGDPRAAWLDRPDAFIRSTDIGLNRSELAKLADLLRTLHGASMPYPDQSVRGGTQTDRPLLFRHEPIVQRTRDAIEAAVRSYVAQLPPVEEGHPLLGTPREELRFAGSWSVRLRAQGYHACHSHPAGWISSALYISLPDGDAMGAAPAGWLRFGTPPTELGPDLAPYGEVEPAEGKLVLFPSTMWHGTMPFADGERLSIAFDIAQPRY